MAQPIPLKLPPRDPKQELLARLEQAPAEHAAALLDGYELLEELHKRGIFTLIRGVLGATDKMVEAAAAGANSEESIRAMRNAILLAKTLGSIDPAVMQMACAAAKDTFGDARSVSDQTPGAFALLAVLLGRDVRRVMGLLTKFLENFAGNLKSITSGNAGLSRHKPKE